MDQKMEDYKKTKRDASNLEELISQATVQVNEVFQPKEEQLADFQNIFTTIAINEILDGCVYAWDDKLEFYGFNNGGNTPSSNIKEALVESGIESTGTLPIGRAVGSYVPITGDLMLEAQLKKEEMAIVADKNSTKSK